MAGLRAALSGAFSTAMGRRPGLSALDLQAEAALGALADAQLAGAAVDGLICGYALSAPHILPAQVLCEHMGLRPDISFGVQAGGASGCIMVMQAAALVSIGLCRHVLVVAGDSRLSGITRDQAVMALAEVGHPELERPLGMGIPAAYGLVAARYMHEHGTTVEQLAAVAVAHRQHAIRHPQAHMRTPLSVADVMASRVISSPLRLLDCCIVSDGGAAVMVSAIETAAELSAAPVHLLGAAQAQTHAHLVAAPSLTHFACADTARRALAQAGVGTADIDVAAIYDSFTITLVIELESMGFFAPGEAGAAIAAGALDLGGTLPCNTHGGMLSHGGPGVAGGLAHVVEAVTQLRHAAGARQVANARTAFVHGDGGVLSTHCSLVLGTG
jgi:acetyl-CoA acetyltransferase